MVTAPLHGFRDTDDYWTRASAKPWLAHIRVPTLIVNARNDPFLPGAHLPRADEVSPQVDAGVSRSGRPRRIRERAFPGRIDWLPRRIAGFFDETRG